MSERRTPMMGWRARVGVLVPPGNPTVEPELAALMPPGCAIYATRMSASGETGSLDGQEERNREQIASLDGCCALLAAVNPSVIALAHTATSTTLGRVAEAALTSRLTKAYGAPVITAVSSVLAALAHLGVRRIGYGTPYSADATRRGQALLEEHGLEVVRAQTLPGVRNIYDETAERAYALGRMVDHPDAEAIFLSGVGMPTIATLAALEADLGKPVISATSALAWNALRRSGVAVAIPGYGRLLYSP